MPASATNRGWHGKWLMTVRTTGTTGAVTTHDDVTFWPTPSSLVDFNNGISTNGTLDTTAAKTLNLTATWATANTANTITLTHAVLRLLNP
jgi:hypothetical protein